MARPVGFAIAVLIAAAAAGAQERHLSAGGSESAKRLVRHREAGAQERQISASGRVSADVDVAITNLAGTVTVTAWERNEIDVRGTRGAGTRGVSFENDGDEVAIDVDMARGGRREAARNGGRADLRIQVPSGASVRVESLGADVVIVGVAGDIRVETSAGSVTYSGGSPDIAVETAAGDIEIASTSNAGSIDVEAVAGDVSVEFGGGDVRASTLTGEVRVLGGRLDRGDFESLSGDLYFEGDIGAGARIAFENFDGGVELIVPPATSARFDIGSYAGSIDTEFGYEGVPAGGNIAAEAAVFTLGAGDAEVSIATFSGDVRVRHR